MVCKDPWPGSWCLPASPLTSLLTTSYSRLPLPGLGSLPARGCRPPARTVPTPPPSSRLAASQPLLLVPPSLLREAWGHSVQRKPPRILPSARGCLLLSLSDCNAHSPCRCRLPKQITWPHKAEPVSVLAATMLQGPQHFPASSRF